MFFFFIGGVKPKTVTLKKHLHSCPLCGRASLFQKRVDHYFHLFFISLFPLKKGKIFSVCENCGSFFDAGGSKLETIYVRERICPSCGYELDPEFKYCPRCGKKIS